MSTHRKDNRVFRSGRRNVLLNFRHSPDSEFGFYGRAFHDAAQTLANEHLSKPGYSDLEALPILFLYRHAVELYLKAILILGNQLLAIEGREIPDAQLTAVLGRHRLTPFLPHLRTIIEASGAEWFFPDSLELRTFDDLRTVLLDLEEIDAESFAFRYPIRKDGEGSVPTAFTFDLLTCITLMDTLVEQLDAAHTHLEVTWDNICDELSQNGG